MDRKRTWEMETADRAEVAEAASQLRTMVDRVAGPGDGSSWLDKLADKGELGADRPWSPGEGRAAADLLRVAAEVLRTTRARTGGFGMGEELTASHGASSHGLLRRLPMNRKERYFTGTVLPMLIASDGFAHLPRFLQLCGLDQGAISITGPEEVAEVQFFTEYSFNESVVIPEDVTRFGDRPTEADTPDLVLVGPDWLLAVEAKMFHRPTRKALTTQVGRQRILVDYWTRTLGLAAERVAHVLLLPEGLAQDRQDLPMAVVTWEQVLQTYGRVGPRYWLKVLRAALEQYPTLASAEPTFRGNADQLLTGEQLEEGSHPQFGWMGRSGGLRGKRLQEDMFSGRWRSHPYEVRREPLPGNPNWFSVGDFLALVRARERFTMDDAATVFVPPATAPQQVTSVSLHAADKRYLDATLEQDGSVVLHGQDLSFPGEYEYAFTIAAKDVPRLRAALGGTGDQPVLALLESRGEEIYKAGESRWLKEHDISTTFWSRRE